MSHEHQIQRGRAAVGGAAEWVAFNIGVGNMDSHAKNLSLLTKDGRTQLAPFYDLVNTTVYEHLSGRFAFKLGGENRPNWIMERHWDRCAQELQVKPQLLRQIRQDMQSRIERQLPKVADALREQLADPASLRMVDRVQAEVRRCTGRLVRELPSPTLDANQLGVARAPALAGLRDKRAYKAALSPVAPAWSAEQDARATALPRLRQNASGALLAFCEHARAAVEAAGEARLVDWRRVEDAAMRQSIVSDHQEPGAVYSAISEASPGCTLNVRRMALRGRVSAVASDAQPGAAPGEDLSL